MNLNEKQIALLDGLYRNPSLGLLNAPALNTYLKQQGQTGFTINKIKEYLSSLETTQVRLSREHSNPRPGFQRFECFKQI